MGLGEWEEDRTSEAKVLRHEQDKAGRTATLKHSTLIPVPKAKQEVAGGDSSKGKLQRALKRS